MQRARVYIRLRGRGLKAVKYQNKERVKKENARKKGSTESGSTGLKRKEHKREEVRYGSG